MTSLSSRPSQPTLPQPTVILLERLQRAARYLDCVASNCVSDAAYDAAHAHATSVWQAVGRLEDLARLVEELVPFDPTSTKES